MIPFRYGDYSALRGRDFLPEDYDAAAAGVPVVASVTMEGEWDPANSLGEAQWMATDSPPAPGDRRRMWRMPGSTGRVSGLCWKRWRGSGLSGACATSRAPPPTLAELQRGLPGSMSDPRWREGYALLAQHGLHFELQTPVVAAGRGAGVDRGSSRDATGPEPYGPARRPQRRRPRRVAGGDAAAGGGTASQREDFWPWAAKAALAVGRTTSGLSARQLHVWLATLPVRFQFPGRWALR